jgi:hypothetical protein
MIALLLTASVYGQTCDRACLNGFVDLYWSALVAHDPDRLPLTPNARYTENGVTLKLGDGMWGPPSLKMGNYKLYFADPVGGQVGFFGTLIENDHEQIVFLRLKVEDRHISEMETLIVRSAGGAQQMPRTALVDKPIFQEIVPPAERPSRWEMARIANLYFEAMEKGTDKLTPFDPKCQRVENGMITAGNPNGTGMGKMTCGEQFATGFSYFITKVRERRYPIIDEERGLVLAFVFLDHAGTFREFKWTDGTQFKVGAPFDTPYTFIMAELFKIKDRKITQIEAVLLSVPYGMPSGWVPQGAPPGMNVSSGPLSAWGPLFAPQAIGKQAVPKPGVKKPAP